MRKILSFSVLFFLFLILFPTSSLATADFETAYNVRYQADHDGSAHVSQDITLTNKLSNVYATQYTVSFQSTKIRNVQARDELGSLDIDINQTQDSTTITLKFNQQVVGTGKALNFNLSYEALDLVNKTGQVWEVQVPRLTNLAEIDSYQLQLAIPKTFGTPAYVSPQPISTSEEDNFLVYQFTKNQLASAGVAAAFGQFQVFDFILDYHLFNDRLTPITTEIALPPDSAYQKVYLQTLEPKPENVRVDEDGNWLARYYLSGDQRLNIQTTGKVKIFSQPQKNFLPPTQSTLEKNLQEQKYWPVSHFLINEKANQLNSIEEVYDFVVDYLSYDYERVKKEIERKGALEALGNPDEAICMEFTDLFITLARTIGVPAREINGFAYTTNPTLRPLSLVSDVLHSWPEYWDEEKGIWAPVDPTWEKTTGGVDFFNKTDMNHFIFAIHGLDSELPAPAGSYRDLESDSKNVQVNFGKFENIPESKVEVEFGLPKVIFAGIKTRGKIIIHNLGPTAIYQLATEISGENVGVSEFPNQETFVIPPYGKGQIPLELLSENWFKIDQAKVNLSLNGQSFSQPVKIQSLVWQFILPMIGLWLILGVSVFFLIRLTVKKRNVTSKKEE